VQNRSSGRETKQSGCAKPGMRCPPIARHAEALAAKAFGGGVGRGRFFSEAMGCGGPFFAAKLVWRGAQRLFGPEAVRARRLLGRDRVAGNSCDVHSCILAPVRVRVRDSVLKRRTRSTVSSPKPSPIPDTHLKMKLQPGSSVRPNPASTCALLKKIKSDVEHGFRDASLTFRYVAGTRVRVRVRVCDCVLKRRTRGAVSSPKPSPIPDTHLKMKLQPGSSFRPNPASTGALLKKSKSDVEHGF